MNTRAEAPGGLAFRHFQLLPYRRELLTDGTPVRLGGRAFDVLMALVDARGAVVNTAALIARVWPGQVVEANSLQSQISDLRAAFGSDRDLIRTVSNRGYQFTGEVRALSPSPEERIADPETDAPGTGAPPTGAPPTGAPPTNLPEPAFELIGREDVLGEILDLTAAHRLVTLTGTGGIGKTRLAMAAGHRLLADFPDGVWLVELSPLADPALVPAMVAAAIGIELGGGEISARRVAQALAGRQLLLVLDTCEHVIAAAAALAEAILRATRGTRTVATSREPLEVEEEWVYPIPALAVPAPDVDESDVLDYGAVRLFVARARAGNPRFVPEQRLAGSIAAICRRLDGIPLAIEMAAARASAFPLEEITALLDDRLRLLTARRRLGLPRHQTLRATLDWSHDLLAEPERVVLRRLAICVGAFSLEAVGAIVADPPEISRWAAVEALSSLVAKSLVVADIGSSSMPYRLLDTTRAYALEKLHDSGEHTTLARRHAEYYRDLFARAEAEADAKPAAEWGAEYGRALGNLRAALDWAFSPAGDPSIGVALTAVAVPLWMHLSTVDECRRRVEQALAALQTGAGGDVRQEMKLHAARARTAVYTGIGGVADVGMAWTAALELAEKFEDTEYQLRSLRGLWFFHNMSGRHGLALAAAERFCALAANQPSPNEQIIGERERMMGVSHYYKGDYATARRYLEHVLATYVDQPTRAHMIRFEYHPRVTARTILARILWLQGFPDQAMQTADAALADARATQSTISLLYALVQAPCPVALWCGDLPAAEHYVRTLVARSAEHGVALGQAFGRCYQGMLDIQRGDPDSGARLLLDGVESFGNARSVGLRLIAFMVSDSLRRAGHIAEALGMVEAAIASSEENEDRWHMAELLRVRGELLLLRGRPGEAEDDFRQALDWARRQGALAWELRAAISLARLLRDADRTADAMALLRPVYDRFTEGFGTADLMQAAALLGIVRCPGEASPASA